MKIITDPHCVEYSKDRNPEKPQRVGKTVERLQTQDKLPLCWGEPLVIDHTAVLRAHRPELLQRLSVPEDFEVDTPAYPNILNYAWRSVGGALAALESTRKGIPGFSLMRPPGHHATRTRAMGFCFLNNVAIAALEARATGYQRVGVFDFDVHHGNGTEDILLDQPGVAYASVHEDNYPYTGKEFRGTNSFNFPAPPETSRTAYLAKLSAAMDELKNFRPDLLAISAGFDAYREDPLSSQNLEVEDYYWLGESIRKFGVPVFTVLEGGYSDALPELVLAYLCGLAGK